MGDPAVPPKRAAIYGRVSKRKKSKGQDEPREEHRRDRDPENQLSELRVYCEREGYTLAPEHEYVDRETGTGKRRRSRFEEMLEDAEHGEFQILLIWALDRLSRDGTLKTLLILDGLNACGVKVKSLREPWLDPASPTYELLLSVFAWVARQEAMRISERVRAGLTRARAQGKRLGRKPKYGDRAADIVGQAVRLRGEGKSLRAISDVVGLSRSRVCQILLQKATLPPPVPSIPPAAAKAV